MWPGSDKMSPLNIQDFQKKPSTCKSYHRRLSACSIVLPTWCCRGTCASYSKDDEAPLLLGAQRLQYIIHVDHPHHSMELENTKILTTESTWLERGVKEAIYIRGQNPSLIIDGRRHNLHPVWGNIEWRQPGPGAGVIVIFFMPRTILLQHSVGDRIKGVDTSQWNLL